MKIWIKKLILIAAALIIPLLGILLADIFSNSFSWLYPLILLIVTVAFFLFVHVKIQKFDASVIWKKPWHTVLKLILAYFLFEPQEHFSDLSQMPTGVDKVLWWVFTGVIMVVIFCLNLDFEEKDKSTANNGFRELQ